jgi:hypothetical protein
VQIERFAGTIDGEQGSGALRVTMIFRRESEAGRYRIAMPTRSDAASDGLDPAGLMMEDDDLRNLMRGLDPHARDTLRSLLIHDRQTVTRSPRSCSAAAMDEATTGPTSSTC